MPASKTTSQKLAHYAYAFCGMAVGAFFEALAIRLFLVPNELIDGGVIGISLILARLFHQSYLS